MVGGERVEIAHHEDSTNKHRGVVRKGCTCIIEREGGGGRFTEITEKGLLARDYSYTNIDHTPRKKKMYISVNIEEGGKGKQEEEKEAKFDKEKKKK